MDTCTILTGIGSVAAVTGILYSFLRNFKEDIKKEFNIIDKRFDVVDRRFDKLDEEIKEIKTDIKVLQASVYRLEGAFYNKDCCMLKEDKRRKKAE